MPRSPRADEAGGLYHALNRANLGANIYRKEGDFVAFEKVLHEALQLYEVELYAYQIMPNHLHLFLRTPRPNLSQGMQYLLSGYANWYAKRHQRTGHLFQGRFKGELIEDDSYFWTVSRYVHLNPRRGRRPLVEHPRDWPWSSYPGYALQRSRVGWVAYDALYAAWQGEVGGQNATVAYPNLIRRGEEAIAKSKRLATDVEAIVAQLTKVGNRV